MGRVKERLDRIEEKMEIKPKDCILVEFPEIPGFTHGDRVFRSVEDAVEILEKEWGRKINPIVLEVSFVSPKKVEPQTLEEGRI